MPDIPIRQSDIDSLAEKLSTLESTLSTSERALLAGIFAMASTAIRRASSDSSAGPPVSRGRNSEEPVTTVAVNGPVPSIPEQFARAFTPGAAEDEEPPSVGLETIPGRAPSGDKSGPSPDPKQPVKGDDEESH